MSYTPTLVIRKKDLENATKILEEQQYFDDNTSRVAEYLLVVNEYPTVKFDDLELVLCEPETSSFSLEVRNKLKELKIDFREDN
jgi:hypothetical protein